MPEYPEIYTSAHLLDNKLRNYTITSIIATDNCKQNMIPYINKLQDNLPLKITEIFCRAKRINFICEDNKGNGSVIVWFYALKGRLSFEEVNNYHLCVTCENESKIFNRTLKLYYSDPMKLGFMKYCNTIEQINEIYKNLGPDYIEITLLQFITKISNPRSKNTKIGDFLMDQKKFAGIGNYLRAEILYDAKISPYTSLSQIIENKQINTLMISINEILNSAIELGGLESKDYLDPENNTGNYQSMIYDKKTDMLGNIVTSEKFGKDRRTIWWVKNVQL